MLILVLLILILVLIIPILVFVLIILILVLVILILILRKEPIRNLNVFKTTFRLNINKPTYGLAIIGLLYLTQIWVTTLVITSFFSV